MTGRCRACSGAVLHTVLDLGTVPAADDFPPAARPVTPAETTHQLRMVRCARCELAQLAEDDTVGSEPRGVEPQALRDQAADAIARVDAAGLLRGNTVIEFGSPHGGSWLPLLAERGCAEADAAQAELVLDCFGIMHEPDQRAAFAARAAAVAPGGLLLLQYHSLAAIVAQRQWNALRHGHFAYYSLHALSLALTGAGMSVTTAWEFDLYGGTVLVAARRGPAAPDRTVREILSREREIITPESLRLLQRFVDDHVRALRTWLIDAAAAGQRVYAYGAASRAVALLSLAGAHQGLVAGVADVAPAKRGRRMPGTDIPIISPRELIEAAPDRVLLTLPDLLGEVSSGLPELDGRWFLDDPRGPRKGGVDDRHTPWAAPGQQFTSEGQPYR
ncbi:class I SAM-dependent methyltransferase [Nocardia sp. NPDC003999]